MKTLSARLKFIRDYYKLSQAAFSEKINMSLKRIQNIEANKIQRFNEEELDIFMNMGISKVWLLTGEGGFLREPDFDKTPLQFYQEGEEFSFFKHGVASMQRQAASLCVMRVEGNSMASQFKEGDYIFVDTDCNKCDKEGVYVFRLSGQVTVRLVQFEPGCLRLISRNNTYRDIELKPNDVYDVIGRVVGVMGFL